MITLTEIAMEATRVEVVKSRNSPSRFVKNFRIISNILSNIDNLKFDCNCQTFVFALSSGKATKFVLRTKRNI
jgi:hypothetical protein